MNMTKHELWNRVEPFSDQQSGKVLCSMYAVLNTADRRMLEVQRQLKNYKGTLTGKMLLKKGDLKKCTRKGELKTCTLFVVSCLSERI